MKEPDDNSNETYRLIYATYMREIYVAQLPDPAEVVFQQAMSILNKPKKRLVKP